MALGGVYSAEGILKIAFVIHRVVFLLNLLHAMFLGRSLTISSSQNVRKTSISSSTKNNLKETSSPRLLGYRPFFWRYPVQLASCYDISQTSPIFGQPNWLSNEFEALARRNEPIRNVVNVKKGFI